MDLEGGGGLGPHPGGGAAWGAATAGAAVARHGGAAWGAACRCSGGAGSQRVLDRSAAAEPWRRRSPRQPWPRPAGPGAERTIAAVGCSPYDERGVAAASYREPRADPRGRAGARRRAERDHGGDRRGEDDPLERDRASARGARRRRAARPRRRRGVGRGRVRPSRRRGARRARRPAARRRGDARARPAHLRRRADARLRVGTQRGQGGRRGGRRGAPGDERAVRAAAAGARELPACGARCLRRDRRTRPRGPPRVARARRGPPRLRVADARRRGSRGEARRAARPCRGRRRPHRRP